MDQVSPHAPFAASHAGDYEEKGKSFISLLKPCINKGEIRGGETTNCNYTAIIIPPHLETPNEIIKIAP